MYYLSRKMDLVKVNTFDVISVLPLTKTEVVKKEDGTEEEKQVTTFALVGTKYLENATEQNSPIKLMIEGEFSDEPSVRVFYSKFLDLMRRDIKFFTYSDIITQIKGEVDLSEEMSEENK